MQYKELVSYTIKCIGTINFGFFGRLCNKYNSDYIVKTLNGLKTNYKIKTLSPMAKIAYLAGILRNKAQKDNYKNTKDLDIDVENFRNKL